MRCQAFDDVDRIGMVILREIYQRHAAPPCLMNENAYAATQLKPRLTEVRALYLARSET
jgi:hypothetical protein